MKRSYDFHEKPSSKHSRTCSSDSFRSKITTKLRTLFEGFVSELQNISQDKRSDVTFLFRKTDVDKNCHTNSLSQSNDNATADAATLVLHNFINSAKSRISGLLGTNQTVQDSNENNLLAADSKSFSVDPLQIQISLKLQELLSKALDNKQFVNNVGNKTTSKDIISESEWQDLSHLLHNFMSTAKEKLSFSLSRNLNKSQSKTSATVQNNTTDVKLASRNGSKFHNTTQSSNSHKYCQNKELQIICHSNFPICEQDSSQYKGPKTVKRNLRSQAQNSQTITVAPQLKMESSDYSDSSSHDAPTPGMHTNGTGGILLLGEAEKAPDYLDLNLEVDSDVDDPSFENEDSDSDEEVVVLGEKRPTYQEITLDEDDDGEVYEKVIEVEKPVKLPIDIEELLYDCPKCEKKFRVESLLKFHIRMHSVVESHGRVESPSPIASASETEFERNHVKSKDGPPQNSRSNQSYLRKEKENKKSNSKTSHKHKIRCEKYEKHSRRRSKVPA